MGQLMTESSLTYLETKLLHPTRTARFASARRLRLTQTYSNCGQLVAAVVLIFWSLVPIYYPSLAGQKELSFFGVMASLTVLVLGLYQQASGYADSANSLEDSARRIDGLRRKVQGAILAGKDQDPEEYVRLSGKYTKILADNPSNHSTYDHAGLLQYAWLRWVPRGILIHLRASFSFVLTIVIVLIVPAVLLTK